MAAPRTPPLPLPHPIEPADEWGCNFKNMPKTQIVGGYLRESRYALQMNGARFGGGEPITRIGSRRVSHRCVVAHDDETNAHG